MKKVEAIIRKSKFSAVKEALHEVGVNFFSYWDVTGLGNEKEGHVYQGVSYSTSDIQRRFLSIVVNDDFEEVTISFLGIPGWCHGVPVLDPLGIWASGTRSRGLAEPWDP